MVSFLFQVIIISTGTLTPGTTAPAISTPTTQANPFDPTIGPQLAPTNIVPLPSFAPLTQPALGPIQGPPQQPPAPQQPPPAFVFPAQPSQPTQPTQPSLPSQPQPQGTPSR